MSPDPASAWAFTTAGGTVRTFDRFVVGPAAPTVAAAIAAGDGLRVPAFPRVHDYTGVWAIREVDGAALWAKARGIDLAAHVAAATAANAAAEARAQTPKPRAEFETVKVGAKESVAIIRLENVLMKAVSSMDPGTSTVRARRLVRAAAADPEVDGILLAIDSPGGTLAGTADLAADVREAAKRKPVYAFIADLGASAAYWIAAAADKVYANDRTALVGSIGTLLVVYDLSKLAAAQGVEAIVFGTGPLKGAGTEGAPVTDAQRDYFRAIVEDAQKSFDAAVRKGRGLTEKQLADVRTGGVFGADEALDRKLVDGIQGMEAVLSELAAEARRRRKATNARAEGPVIQGGPTVNEPTTTAVAETDPAVADPVLAQRAAYAAERQRIATIRAKFGGKHPDIEARAVAEGWDVPRASTEYLEAELAEVRNRPAPNVITGRSHDRDCTLQALQGAMILRAGGRLDHACYQGLTAIAAGIPGWLRAGINQADRNRHMEAAHRYADLSMIDLCREALRLDGRDVPHNRTEMIRAAFSTGGSLTEIFTTNVNAILLMSYVETTDTTQGWTSSVDVADFKTQERPRMEKGPGLKRLPRGQEADHAAWSSSAESYKIARYARQFVIDEQDAIDDNMGVFQKTPVEFGAAAARLRPDLVYAILKANAALVDAVALFHSTHANTDTSAALAAATLKAGITRVLIQTENSVNLNIRPTHLIVPATLDFTGRELLNSSAIVLAGTAGTVTERGNANTIQDYRLTLVSDSRLDNGVVDPATETTYAGDVNDWFLAAAGGHTIEVGYLRGTGRAPQVRSFNLTEGKWGIGWDVKMDIGAKALDYRSLYRGVG